MPAPIIPLALGAGALWLLSQLKGTNTSGAGGGASPPPTSTPVVTNPGGINSSAIQTTAITSGIGIGATAVGTLVTAGIKAATSGASAAASASNAGADAAEIGADAALIGIDVGAEVIGALYITFIIACIVTDQVLHAIEAYKSQVAQLLGYDTQANSPTALAAVYRIKAENFTTALLRTSLLNGNPNVILKYTTVAGVPGNYFVDNVGNPVPQAQMSAIVQTCFYLGLLQQQAYDDAATLFWTFHGDNLSQQQSRGESLNVLFPTMFLTPILVGMPIDYPPSLQGHYLTDTLIPGVPQLRLTPDGRPMTMSGLQATAQSQLGPTFAQVVARAQAIGACQAVAMASIAGYSFNWPGEPLFAQTIGANTVPSWSGAQRTLAATAGSASTTQITDWWLTDPVTGISVAPDSCRQLTQFVISIPQAPAGSLQGFSGYGDGRDYGRRRVVSGRSKRLGRFGATAFTADGSVATFENKAFVDDAFNNPESNLTLNTGVVSASQAAARQYAAQQTQNIAGGWGASSNNSGGGISPVVLGLGALAGVFFLMKGGKK